MVRFVSVAFNCPPPLGVFHMPWQNLIDFDESEVMLEKCNGMREWAVKVLCVQKDGHYHQWAKITVIFASKPGDPGLAPHIRGSIEHPQRMRHWNHNQYFCYFCDYVCRDIETNHIPGTDLHSILIWDNLAAHHSRYLHNTVANRVSPSNFSIIPWPPYHPKYGPIEYKICEVMEKI